MAAVIHNLCWCGGVALALGGCTGTATSSQAQADGEEPRLERSGQPMNPQRIAARIALARGSAMMGDEAGVRTQLEAINEENRRAVKLPDMSRPIDRERARGIVRGIDGVRSVAWVDRSNLLVRVGGAKMLDQTMIDRICIGLQPLGDTLAVVVNLQDAAARSHGGMQTLSRNCQLQGEDRAMFQDRRKMDALPETWRRQQTANKVGAATKTSDEAMDIIRDSTPEM